MDIAEVGIKMVHISITAHYAEHFTPMCLWRALRYESLYDKSIKQISSASADEDGVAKKL